MGGCGDDGASEEDEAADRPRARHRPPWKRIVYPIIGLLFMCLAALGAVLPFLQGWIFFVIGLPLLLAFYPPWEEKAHELRHRLWVWIRGKFGKRQHQSSKVAPDKSGDRRCESREGDASD
jgi:hypothetical protein